MRAAAERLIVGRSHAHGCRNSRPCYERPANLEGQKLALARELLDDTELSRLAPEQLLLKASRLPRLVETTDVLTWLEYELRGYYNNPDHLAFAERVGRVTDKAKRYGHWAPLASLAAQAQATLIQIQQLQVPSVNFAPSSANPHEYVMGFAGAHVAKLAAPAETVLARLQALTTQLGQYREIQSRVIAEIHAFAVRIYHWLAFSGAAESIFTDHQRAVDTLLRTHAGDVLQKIPTICSRLSESDPEAISQALNSCRRMIKAFADALQPADDREVEVVGRRCRWLVNVVRACRSTFCSICPRVHSAGARCWRCDSTPPGGANTPDGVGVSSGLPSNPELQRTGCARR